MTVVFLFVDIALMFNQYVNPVALTNIGWKYYIVYVRINGTVARTQTYLKSVFGLPSSSLSSGGITSKHGTRLWRRLQSTSREMTRW